MGRGLRRALGVIIVMSASVAACLAPEPQFIVPTRGIGELDCPPATPRVMTQVVTATPIPLSPTGTPFPLRVFLPAGSQVSGEIQARLAERLGDKPGVPVLVSVPGSEAQAVHAICNGLADIAWLTSQGYLVAHDACGAQARFTVMRDGVPSSRAQVLAQADNLRRARDLAPILSLSDLAGKRFGYTEVFSMTGHITPKAMLMYAGVTPSEELFVAGEAQAVLAVYRGEVDAAAGSWRPPLADGSPGDSRRLLLEALPEAVRNVKIVALSPPIPNEPIVFRPALARATEERLTLALTALSADPDGRTILAQLGGISGLTPANDQDYDPVRRMAEMLGLDLQRMLEGRALY